MRRDGRSWAIEAMTDAAMSRSLTFRELEARFNIATAVSWLHRFWAMTTPTAVSMAVLDSTAAIRLCRASLSRAIRTASWSDPEAMWR